jgi:hypothetical protein
MVNGDTPPLPDYLEDYLYRGWSIFPVGYRNKRPLVPWKQYQSVAPSRDRVIDWHWDSSACSWAVALGPVSNLFAIDIDGKEAYDTLINKLGDLPATPTVMTGSRSPHRLHLYFKYPNGIKGKAKHTPWCESLEFRSAGGCLVLPPSIHPSGRAYEWCDGKALDDLPLAEVPREIVEACERPRMKRFLKDSTYSSRHSIAPLAQTLAIKSVRFSRATHQFLRGEHAEGPRWNDKMFRAACDMAGCGYTFDEAVVPLLRGANPYGSSDEEQATATIKSAFNENRYRGIDGPSNQSPFNK